MTSRLTSIEQRDAFVAEVDGNEVFEPVDVWRRVAGGRALQHRVPPALHRLQHRVLVDDRVATWRCKQTNTCAGDM